MLGKEGVLRVSCLLVLREVSHDTTPFLGSHSVYRYQAAELYIAISPLTMSWATVTIAGDAEERAVVTASMNAIGQAISAGTQVVQYPTTGAPNFHAGFSSALATTVAQLLCIVVIIYLSTKGNKQAHRVAAALSV